MGLQKCVLSMQKCVLSMQKCVLSMRKCVLGMQKCVLGMQKCVLSMQKCVLIAFGSHGTLWSWYGVRSRCAATFMHFTGRLICGCEMAAIHLGCGMRSCPLPSLPPQMHMCELNAHEHMFATICRRLCSLLLARAGVLETRRTHPVELELIIDGGSSALCSCKPC